MRAGRAIRGIALGALLVGAAACGGGKASRPDGGGGTGGVTGLAGIGGAAGGSGGASGGAGGTGGATTAACVDRPGTLDRPPAGRLPCELIPPGLSL